MEKNAQHEWSPRKGVSRFVINNFQRSETKLSTVQTLVDIELFSDIRRIEDALSRRSCTEALAWCSENKNALRKVKVRFVKIWITFYSPFRSQSTLEFDLRMQEYIELSRERKTMEAIAYSQKYLVSWQDTHLPQIRQLSALLAFPPTTTCGPYKVRHAFCLVAIVGFKVFCRDFMILPDGTPLLRTSD